MKIVTPKEMGRIEQLAYDGGASEKAFMLAAGAGVAEVVEAYVNGHDLPRLLFLLCGKGNNGGDAYVVGQLLMEKGYSVVAVQLAPLEESSPLCREMANRFTVGGGTIEQIREGDSISFEPGVIIDALFGTGFKGKCEGIFASVIDQANESGLPILAIDIPSGLNGETGKVEGSAVRAAVTIYLGQPKKGFFLENGPDHTGQLIGRSFGLGEEFVAQAEGCGELLGMSDVALLLPPIQPSRHKYQAGHLLLVAGSPGMPGAALLAGSAALRSGSGIVRLFHPAGMEAELAAGPYELIRQGYVRPEELVPWIEKANAIVVGPGIGRTSDQVELLRYLFTSANIPMVIDADALTLITEENLTPPKESLLTPHVGEMGRLLGKKDFGMDEVAAYAADNEVTVLLKGRATHIFSKQNSPFVSTWGDPGMATAGSGDVLSGILGSLLAQGLEPLAAAKLGAYLHGKSGEIAAAEQTSYGMIASDLIEWLPEAIHQLENQM